MNPTDSLLESCADLGANVELLMVSEFLQTRLVAC